MIRTSSIQGTAYKDRQPEGTQAPSKERSYFLILDRNRLVKYVGSRGTIRTGLLPAAEVGRGVGGNSWRSGILLALAEAGEGAEEEAAAEEAEEAKAEEKVLEPVG